MPRGSHNVSRGVLPGAGVAVALCLALAGCTSFSHAPRHSASGDGAPSRPASSDQCGSGGKVSSYVVYGRRYHVLKSSNGYDERGIASWYGRNFHGKLTSSGAPYNMYAKTAASKILPLCTWVKVTNLENGKSVVVQINDRGPFVANRIIDLSYAAAKNIGMMRKGTALVNVRALAGPSASPPRDIEQKSRAAPTPTLHHRARLYLQLGAFTHRDNAEKLRARLVLQQAGQVRIQRARVHGKRFYRVQVGPYGSVSAIDSAATRLEKLGYHDTEVIIE